MGATFSGLLTSLPLPLLSMLLMLPLRSSEKTLGGVLGALLESDPRS